MKVHLPVSEVRPLMDRNHSRINQNQDQPVLVQVQKPNQHGPDPPQQQEAQEESSSSRSTLKKKVQTEVEPRRNLVLPTHQNQGLHKAQSVNSLLADAGKIPNPTRSGPVKNIFTLFVSSR